MTENILDPKISEKPKITSEDSRSPSHGSSKK